MIRVLPESLPWLCLNGYNKEAARVARKAAAINGVTLPDDIFETNENEMSQLTDGQDEASNLTSGKDSGFTGRCSFFIKYQGLNDHIGGSSPE